MPDQASIFAEVRACLAASLATDADSIALDSRLIEDLGADSLDFIDIVFSLERRFAVKLKSAELDSLLRADFVPERPSEQPYVARADIDRLLEWLPALRDAPDLDRVLPYQLFSYITTQSLVLLVARKLEAAGIG